MHGNNYGTPSREIQSSELVFSNGREAVTSTVIIARETGNEHASVIKLVRAHQSDFEEFGRVDFKSTRQERGGHPVEEALLNQEQATLLMTYMRNSEVVRAFKKQLVKAFFEFARRAQAPAFTIPQTLPEALRLAADLAESNAQQQARLAVVEPKAEALDRIATGTEGSLNITEAAKTLQVNPMKLFQWLSVHKWIYRRVGGSSWVAYQDKIQSGLLEHKIATVHRSDGSEKITEQVRVTANGLTRLAGIFRQSTGEAA